VQMPEHLPLVSNFVLWISTTLAIFFQVCKR
jgi:hypothetical protein